MIHRPRATLGRVLDDLGSTLLEVAAGSVDPLTSVDGVVIHDPLDPPVLPERALVLGVGLSGAEPVGALLRELGGTGAVGLVVRVPVEIDDEVRAAAKESGVVLFGLTRGASWVQVALLLRSLLAVDDLAHTDGETIGGDLFALANAIASLLDAPITIEDLSSRVLAFSSDQDKADEPRKQTVLGRQVPGRYLRELEARGTFRRLYGTDRPVYLDDIPGTGMPRVAIRVRAGDEILGSVWAAVTGPLSPEREQALIDSAKLVALHMLRHRAGADVERRLRAGLVATLLEGGPSAPAATERLGVASGPVCVLALGLRDDGEASRPEASRVEAELQRVSGAFALHLSAVHPRSAVALVGGVVYGVLPVASDRRAALVAGEFLDRMGAGGQRVLAGVGRVVTDALSVPRSRADADRALRVLRTGGGASRVARAEDVQASALLLELGDLAAVEAQQPAGPVARLAEYDRANGSQLVETLRVWLDTFGEVAAAAAAMHVHPNTFRYRLRRVADVGGIDLDDPESRFGAMLQLRLFDMPGGHRAARTP
jgi:DNA-binding PucR family transcriptional regulator